ASSCVARRGRSVAPASVMVARRRLLATPLAAWERDGLKSALAKAGLPADDVGDPRLLFWRFESYEDVPAGFRGLEIHGTDALLRSVVTLPPVRQTGIGAAIVAALETEARARKCRAIYLLTTSQTDYFAALGYAPCPRSRVPQGIRDSRQFAALCPANATAIVKRTSLRALAPSRVWLGATSRARPPPCPAFVTSSSALGAPSWCSA